MNSQRIIVTVVAAILCMALFCPGAARAAGPSGGCVGDLTGSGAVGVPDLLILLGAWGPCIPKEGSCAADLNGDANVGVPDLLILLGAWGDCPGIPPGTVYTELNYIDPLENDCPEGLCTNGIGGVVTQKSPPGTGYFSPATAWTQSQDGTLHTLRVIVFGYVDWVNKTGPFTTFVDFEPFNYELEIWHGFSAYAANPGQGDIIITNIWPPANHVQRGTNLWGDPTFEWTFDFSDYEIELQAGQQYILMLRAIGHFSSYVARSGSTWPGGPDVMATSSTPANYMDQSPWNFINPRMGTEIRVRTPSGE